MTILSLIWLILAPIVIALIIMFPRFPNHQVKVRRFAKWCASFHFIYSLLFLAFFDTGLYGMSYEKELTIGGLSWLKNLGISIKFGVDGMSLLFVVLTIFIVLMTLFISKMHIRTKHKLYYSMIFLLESSVLGLLCAKDMFLFFVFWELCLVPIYFLVSQWGNADARRVSSRFLILSFVANAFLFLAMLILYYYNFAVSNVLTANIDSLSMDENIYPLWFRVMVFSGFLIGFAVKIPFVPLHSWYPSIQSSASAPINVLLAGLLTCSGVYGLVRFNMQIFPDVFKLFAPLLVVWALLNMVYAGALTIVQNELKKMVSYAQIATAGFIMLGLGSLTQAGFDGAIFMTISCAILYSALFLIIASVEYRTKTSFITALGGLGQVMPKCMYLSLIVVLSAIGVPFLMTFVPKLMIITGTLFSDLEQELLLKLSAIISLAVVFASAGFALYFFYKVFCSVLLEQWKKIKDLSMQESCVLTSLCLLMLYIGLNPMGIVQIYQSFSSIILDVFQV